MFESISFLDPSLGIWFLAFALSLLCLVSVGYGLVLGKQPRSFWPLLAIRLALLGLALLAVADFLGRLPAMQAGVELVGRAFIVGLGILAVYLLVPSNRREKSGSERVSWGIVGVAIAATVWTSIRFYSSSLPSSVDLNETIAAASPDPYLSPASHVAVTDRGEGVPLYEFLPPKEFYNGREVVPLELRDRLIAAGPIDRQSNCHGWVFTGGKHVVRGAAVDHILADNGYQRVAEPMAGDLIIYRDRLNQPSHTGLVKATGKEGFVLIESKWGFFGRYLHEPNAQCYSRVYHYYRSDRADHLLHVKEPVEEPSGELSIDLPKLADK